MNAESGIEECLSGLPQRIKKLRISHGISLGQLSMQTGISKSTLSRLEAGTRKPNLELLLPVSLALGLTIEELVKPPQPARSLTNGRGGTKNTSHSVRRLTRNKAATAVFAINIPGSEGFTPVYSYPGSGLLYLLKGKLLVLLGGKNFELREGEAMDFDTDAPHAFRPGNTDEVELLYFHTREGMQPALRSQLAL